METVIRYFLPFDMIKYSFLSKSTKHLVTSLNLIRIKFFQIYVLDQLGIGFYVNGVFFTFYVLNTYPENDVQIKITYGNVSTIWNLKGYSVKSFIGHFMVISKRLRIDALNFWTNVDLLDGQFLKKNLDGFLYRKVIIQSQGINYKVSPVQVTALEPFLKREILHLVEAPFDRSNSYRLLIQNWDQLYSGSYNGLNDLLLNNSSDIQIRKAILSDNDINVFLKSWMIGSNPRLERVYIYFQDDRKFDSNIIFSGIEPFSKHTLDDQGQMVIQRNDGTKARINYNDGVFANFEMFLLNN